VSLKSLEIIGRLLEQFLPLAVSIYSFIRNEIAQAGGTVPLKTVEELLAEANFRLDEVIAKADAEIAGTKVTG